MNSEEFKIVDEFVNSVDLNGQIGEIPTEIAFLRQYSLEAHSHTNLLSLYVTLF